MMYSLILAALLAASPAAPARAPELRPPPAPELQESAGSNPPLSYEEAIVALMSWHDDPVLFVRQVFGAVPDAWQADALRSIARDPRVGMSACKGPGKSCNLAWAVWWFLATREDAQIIAVSITLDNLRDNLWKELAFWHGKSPYLQRVFDLKGERITQRDRPKTWWCSARGFAQQADSTQQANTLAGFHGGHVMVVLDEMGDYPDGVVVAAEAIFANEHVAEAKLVAAWNPTRVDGPAYRVCTRDRKRWVIIPITGDPDEPKRSPRVSRAWAQQMIDDWGRDNDWVRVNVLGLFPRVASDKLLGPDDIMVAERRGARREDFQEEPKVMGLDVALYGDDRSVLIMRQGVMCWSPVVWRQLGPSDLADRVASFAMKHQPDMIFVDVTGGYGQGVYEDLVKLGFTARPVDFGGKAADARFLNKRAEMWWRAADWVKKFGCLPTDPELGGELTAPSYTFGGVGKRTVFKIESKDDLKARGLPSPDKADSLILTFAAPVAKRGSPFSQLTQQGQREAQDYQPAIG